MMAFPMSKMANFEIQNDKRVENARLLLNTKNLRHLVALTFKIDYKQMLTVILSLVALCLHTIFSYLNMYFVIFPFGSSGTSH